MSKTTSRVSVQQAYESAITEIRITRLSSGSGKVKKNVEFYIPKKTALVVVGFRETESGKKKPIYDFAGPQIATARMMMNSRGFFLAMPGNKSKKTGKYFETFRFPNRFTPSDVMVDVTDDIKAGLLAIPLWLSGLTLRPNPTKRMNLRESCNVPDAGCVCGHYVGTKDDSEPHELAYRSQSTGDLTDEGSGLPRIMCELTGQFVDEEGAKMFGELARKDIKRVTRNRIIASATGTVIDDEAVKPGTVVVMTADGEKLMTRWELGLMAMQNVAADCFAYRWMKRVSKPDGGLDHIATEWPTPEKTMPCTLVTTEVFMLDGEGKPDLDNPTTIPSTKWETSILPYEVNPNHFVVDKSRSIAIRRTPDMTTFGVIVRGGYRIVITGLSPDGARVQPPAEFIVREYEAKIEANNERLSSSRRQRRQRRQEKQEQKTQEAIPELFASVQDFGKRIDILIGIINGEDISPETRQANIAVADTKFQEFQQYYNKMPKDAQDLFKKVYGNWVQATK